MEKSLQELHFKIPDERVLQISRRASPLAPGRAERRHLTPLRASHRARKRLGRGGFARCEQPPPHPPSLQQRPPPRSCSPPQLPGAGAGPASRSVPPDPGRALPLSPPRRAARAAARRGVRAAPPPPVPGGARPAPLWLRPARPPPPSPVSGTSQVGLAGRSSRRNFPPSSAPQRRA